MFRDFETTSWFWGSAVVACVCVFDWYFEPFAKRKEATKVDRLRVNKSLTFGAQTYTCDKHSDGHLTCKDLNCSHGPLSLMLDMISKATVSVDVCIYTLTSSVFADAFIDAHNRGVRVRVIPDADNAFASHCQIPRFKALGMKVRLRISPFIMHHKFVIIDGEILMNGSLNFGLNSALGNWEHVIITSNPLLVEPFVVEFQTLWDEFAPGNLAPSFGHSQFDRYSN